MSATISINLGTGIPAFFGWLFFGKQAKKHHYEILFGGATAGYGEHGTIVGTWIKEGYKSEIAIPFYIAGHKMVPKLTLDLLTEIHHHAAMAGIVVSHLYSYAGLSASNKPQL